MQNIFQVGDRVLCTGEYDANTAIVGKTGTVVSLPCVEQAKWASVEFDSFVDGHSLGGKCPPGRGWNVSVDKLELIDETVTTDVQLGDFFDMF